MSKIPGISIVIPAFKRKEQTAQTLEVLYQSRGWNGQYIPEVIIADSTPDNSVKEAVLQFKDPIPIYTRPQIPGIATNKNTGAKISKNELLIFCDSDMEVEKDTIVNTLIYLKDHPKAAMVGGQVIWKGGGLDGQLDRPRKEDRMEDIDNTVFIEAIYSRYMATYKSLFWKAGGYDEEVFNMRGEGSDLSIRYWRSGLPLSYNGNIRVHHVHDAPVAATRHMEHPERGIIRDLIQLGFKYGLYNKTQNSKLKTQNHNSKLKTSNFSRTLNWLTQEFGEDDKYVIIESVVELLPYFWENREKIEKSRLNIPNEFDFKFLDVFTKKELFLECLGQADGKIREAMEKVF